MSDTVESLRADRDAARLDAERLRTALRVCGDKFSQALEWEAIPFINAALGIGVKPEDGSKRHRPPDFFDHHGMPRYVCECGTVVGLHEFGRHVDCEYYRHHCDPCHERGACTAHDDAVAIADAALSDAPPAGTVEEERQCSLLDVPYVDSISLNNHSYCGVGCIIDAPPASKAKP